MKVLLSILCVLSTFSFESAHAKETSKSPLNTGEYEQVGGTYFPGSALVTRAALKSSLKNVAKNECAALHSTTSKQVRVEVQDYYIGCGYCVLQRVFGADRVYSSHVCGESYLEAQTRLKGADNVYPMCSGSLTYFCIKK